MAMVLAFFALTPHAEAEQNTTVDLTSQTFQAVGTGDGRGPNHNFTNLTTRIGGSITQKLGPNFSITASRSYLDFNVARATNVAGKYVYPNWTDDAINNAHVSYATDLVSMSAGYQQRIRRCCPSANTAAAAPITYHFWYLEADTHFGPVSKLGHWFTVSLQDAQIPHNTNPQFSDPNYPAGSGHFITSEGAKNKLTYLVSAMVPLDRKERIGAFVSTSNAWDYWLNAPIIYLYNSVNYGATATLTPRLSMTATVTNLYQYKQGYPFPGSNTLNRSTLTILWDYRLLK